jgi:hypothetical protein
MRCHRGAEAILLLDEAGFANEGAPIRRSIIEHVVALKWLAVEGNKVADTIARGHAFDTERRKNALDAARWTSVNLDGFANIIKEIDPDNRESSNDYLLNFARRCAEFGDVHTMPGYLAECGQTHPGYESAMSYVNVPAGTIRPTPREQIWQVPFCTTHVLEALMAVREVFDPRPWERELDELGRQYQFVTNEARREDGLRPVDWSTGQLIDEPAIPPT